MPSSVCAVPSVLKFAIGLVLCIFLSLAVPTLIPVFGRLLCVYLFLRVRSREDWVESLPAQIDILPRRQAAAVRLHDQQSDVPEHHGLHSRLLRWQAISYLEYPPTWLVLKINNVNWTRLSN